jgi:hypothetical protein
VIISFAEKFHTAGSGESIESTHNFGGKILNLLEKCPRYAVSNLESSVKTVNKLQHQPVGRQVAFIRDLAANLSVAMFIEIFGVSVKNCVVPQPVRLMNLKIKAN